MKDYIFSTAGDSGAIRTAISILLDTYQISFNKQSHPTHLLLPVPSLNSDGSIAGGGSLADTLAQLPKDITIIGGNLRHPKLMEYKTIDLLEDARYLAENASITAYCAVRYALNELPITLNQCPVLILGWGRIAKCLTKLLNHMGASVSVAARSEADRAMIGALGYNPLKITAVEQENYRLIYNTIPHPVLPVSCSGAVKVDLASVPGIEGSDVIHARGLPGKFAPESSGKLIAKTIVRLLSEKEVFR